LGYYKTALIIYNKNTKKSVIEMKLEI